MAQTKRAQKEHSSGKEMAEELISACRAGNEAKVLSLIGRGCPVDAKNLNGDTALTEAAAAGQERIVRALVESGASFDLLGAHRGYAMFEAIGANHESCVQALLELGAPVNQRDKGKERYGLTPLILASIKGSVSIVEMLLKAGAEKNAYSGMYSALSAAAMFGHAGCLKTLIAAGCDIDMKNKKGDAPIVAAAMMGHVDCIASLIDAGCDLKRRHGGQSVAELARFAASDAARPASLECAVLIEAAISSREQKAAMEKVALPGRPAKGPGSRL